MDSEVIFDVHMSRNYDWGATKISWFYWEIIILPEITMIYHHWWPNYIIMGNLLQEKHGVLHGDNSNTLVMQALGIDHRFSRQPLWAMRSHAAKRAKFLGPYAPWQSTVSVWLKVAVHAAKYLKNFGEWTKNQCKSSWLWSQSVYSPISYSSECKIWLWINTY